MADLELQPVRIRSNGRRQRRQEPERLSSPELFGYAILAAAAVMAAGPLIAWAAGLG